MVQFEMSNNQRQYIQIRFAFGHEGKTIPWASFLIAMPDLELSKENCPVDSFVIC